MEINDTSNNNILFKEKLNDKKTRNIDLIKSYIISQPEQLKKLINFYNKVIVIFTEYISLTQIYSNKLKELAVKIKLNEEEESYQLEAQLFNIIKTILFFNSESLNEIINDIKKGMFLINNDILKKTNENLNNLTKTYFSEINKVISSQKKYEKEMKNYEELLINEEIQNKKEGKKKILNINELKGVIDAQESYNKCIKESNNILKKIINISSEGKQSIREKINKKCFFILDTLIFFTKKQNDNYELQKINLKETYISNIQLLIEEEELNNHFIQPIPYSLKCLEIYMKMKEKKEKEINSGAIQNNIFSSLIGENNLQEELKLKNKICELKSDNILNIVDIITKNKLKLSLNDEKIVKRIISKKEINQIITFIFKDTNSFTEELKNKLYKLFEEDKENILYFFQILNVNRGKENIISNKETFIFLGEIFEYITLLSFDNINVDIFRLLFILSTTYFYKENNIKKYLFIYIKNNQNFKKEEFWEKYFDNFLNKEVEMGLNVYNNLNKNNKTNEEMQKEKNDKFKISLFSNILMVIQNMIDFHFDKDFINNFISKINDKYKLTEIELQQIEIYLNENKDEKNKEEENNNNIEDINTINNIDNNGNKKDN